MIRINLLPAKTSKRQEAVRTELMLGALVGAALVALLIVAQIFMVARVNGVKADNAEIQAEIERKQIIVAEVEEKEALKEDLLRKLQVIKNLKSRKSGPVHMLDELALATPEKLQLTTLDEDGERIQLGGVAVSNEVISEFLSKLELSEYFDEVYLNSIDQTTRSGVKLKNFSITARLVVPGLVEPIVEEKKPAKGKGKGRKAKAKG